MLPESTLNKLSHVVADQLGLNFPPNRWVDLERGILSAARELGIKETIPAVTEWLSGANLTSEEFSVLATFLTVGETYFFREPAGFEIFRTTIIPELIRERQCGDQYLKIWSAGCCTGEEPYTIAMLLKELLPDLQNWKITILATDINRNFLKKAQTGIFSPWSFRETPMEVKNKYFSPSGKNWEINPDLKKMISFEILNLADDLYPSMLTNTQNIDVIFCRNVLMYFKPAQVGQVAHRFFQSLAEKGWLLTSAVELNDEYFSDFAVLKYNQGIFYRKVPKDDNIIHSPRVNMAAGNSVNSGKPAPSLKVKPAQSVPRLSSPVPSRPKATTTNLLSTGEVRDLFEKGQYHQCAQQCIRLLEKKSSDIDVFTLLVKSYANSGNLAEARRWGDKLLLQDGATADSYCLVATIMIEKNETSMAESILKRALFMDQNHVLAHFLMGNLSLRNGNRRTAVKHFKNVRDLLSAFPGNDIVTGFEGLTADRIIEITETLIMTNEK